MYQHNTSLAGLCCTHPLYWVYGHTQEMRYINTHVTLQTSLHSRTSPKYRFVQIKLKLELWNDTSCWEQMHIELKDSGTYTYTVTPLIHTHASGIYILSILQYSTTHLYPQCFSASLPSFAFRILNVSIIVSPYWSCSNASCLLPQFTWNPDARIEY